MRLKWSKSQENHVAQFPNLSVFIGQKLIFRHYCNQNAKDRIQIQAYNFNNECDLILASLFQKKLRKI